MASTEVVIYIHFCTSWTWLHQVQLYLVLHKLGIYSEHSTIYIRSEHALDIVLVVSYYLALQLRAVKVVSKVVFNKKGKMNNATDKVLIQF